MSKNNKTATNIVFILLLIFLLISAIKAQPTPFDVTQLLNAGELSEIPSINSVSPIKTSETEEKKSTKAVSDSSTPSVILTDFENIKPQKVNKTIDKATAMSYTKTRSLSGTEILELAKVKRISDYIGQNKKLVIYVNKGSNSDIQAFVKEFSKTKDKYRNSSKFVFIPLDTIWDINDDNINNTHDRVIHNLKQDCGMFCILDVRGEKLIRLKGTTVSKKGAEIVDVILNSL